MNAVAKPEPVVGLAKLREPFPPHQISKLPKPTKKQTDEVRADFSKGIRCEECGAWHHPKVVHLDYVGHAALTDRLLDVDPCWSWEPFALCERGLPAFDQSGGLWIKLTVLGVTKNGYGNAANKPNQDPGNREKEVIGDALRNAAMRFGAALELWHKGDLHVSDDDGNAATESAPKNIARHDPETLDDAQMAHIQTLLEQAGMDVKQFCGAYKISAVKFLPGAKFGKAVDRLKEIIADKDAKENPQRSNDLDDEIPY